MRPYLGIAVAALLWPWAWGAGANEVPAQGEPAPVIQSLGDAAPPSSPDGFPSPGRPLSDADYLPQILKAYRGGDFAEADILRTKLSGQAAQALSEWFAIRHGLPLGFERIATFRKTYPDWPDTTTLRRRTEEALLAEQRPAAEIRAFFAKQAPLTSRGRIALAFALEAEGLKQEANARIRHVWREDTFGSETESRILERFPSLLGLADHRFRMERLLLNENWGAAQRAAALAGKDYVSLVKARMAVSQGTKAAEKAFAAVPAALRKDPSYLFSRALFLRRGKQLAEAAALILQAPRDAELRVDGDAWWDEKRLIARALLDRGDARTAYALASHHTAESPAQQIEAEFHAGWIALRFLNEPAKAARHFATAAKTASTPISIARAAYWQGRAAETAGAMEDAKLFYGRAADQQTTYYGQLAQEKLGRAIALRTVEPLSPGERRAFNNLLPVQALSLLQQIGETELAISLYAELAQAWNNPGRLDALASLAASQDNPRAVLIVGKSALQRGLPFDLHAYPLSAIPDYERAADEVEPAIVYAVARQESAFNPRAISSAGARGLMQLMPATAKRTAQRFGLDFNLDRLLEDPAYNARLGSAHLRELMEDWKGSHVLVFAAYNAGPGNVRKWVEAYGDPRNPNVDLVDWVERIPFQETRNYVQRVIENLNVYRQRLNPKARPVTTQASTAPAKPTY